MKKMLTFIISVVLLVSIASTSFAIEFDISPFENNDFYTVEFDEMDDTGKISIKDGGLVMASFDNDDNGYILGSLDVKIVENLPPVIRMRLFYIGDDWVFTDKVIIKPSNTRYTFEVDRDTEVSGSKVTETYTIVFTDESIKMLEDIVNDNVMLVKIRLDGKRKLDGSLIVMPTEVKQLLEDYKASGALNNSFAVLKTTFPCSVK